MPFIVSVSHLSEYQLMAGSRALSKAWGGEFVQHECDENPSRILNSLSSDAGLVHLIGDAAITHPDWGSWLEALGAWRQPTILMASPIASGELPGVAAAYVALCKVLSVPLVGIVQIGGEWDPLLRRLDGLPWCGCLSEECLLKPEKVFTSSSECVYDTNQIVMKLRFRMSRLGL